MSEKSKIFENKKSGVFLFKSSNPYEFYQLLNGIDMEPEQDIWGSLIFPEEYNKPCPAVIICHGSAGLRGNHHDHIVNLLEAGIAVFRIHHFESRGIISIVENQTQVTLATMISDAFNALSLISNHPDIDANKIGIAGWSLGGSVAFYSAWQPIIDKLSRNGDKFSAHLPLYPGMLIKPEVNEWSDAPIHILFGEDDDYTPLSLCKKMIEYIKPVRNIDLTTYQSAQHGFDSIEPVEFIPYAIKLKDMFINVDKEGRSTFTDENNKTFKLDTIEDRMRLIKETPNILGAHAGGDWTARRKSHSDFLNFFKSHFFS